jgi:hypothetical protein
MNHLQLFCFRRCRESAVVTRVCGFKKFSFLTFKFIKSFFLLRKCNFETCIVNLHKYSFFRSHIHHNERVMCKFGKFSLCCLDECDRWEIKKKETSFHAMVVNSRRRRSDNNTMYAGSFNVSNVKKTVNVYECLINYCRNAMR